MSDQFIGEIRITPFNFAPQGWALCNGQTMSISQNTALFSLLGTQFGGDGRSNFALPNLQGNAPMHWGNGAGLTQRQVGDIGGVPAVALAASQLPAHTHTAQNAAVSNASAPGPTVTFGGGGRGKEPAYAPASTANAVKLLQSATSVTGGANPHNNMPPYLTLNFIIAVTGIYPSRS